MPRYSDLLKNYQEIESQISNSTSKKLPENLSFLKETLESFRFPEKLDPDMWVQFKSLNKEFSQALPLIQNYIQENDNGGRINNDLIYFKLIERLIERYQQDLDVLFRDILRKFFHLSINKSNYKQLDNLYTNYVLEQDIDDEVSVTVNVAMKIFDADFRDKYDIEDEMTRNILGGIVDKLEYWGEDTTDIIGRLNELE